MKNILDKINKADEIQANKVELGTHEINLGAKEDILKLIQNAIKVAKTNGKINDSADKLANQINSLKKQVPEQILIAKKASQEMNTLNNNIKVAYDKFQAQLKALGLDKNAVPELEKAMQSLSDNDFYSILKDLEYNVTYLDKLK